MIVSCNQAVFHRVFVMHCKKYFSSETLVYIKLYVLLIGSFLPRFRQPVGLRVRGQVLPSRPLHPAGRHHTVRRARRYRAPRHVLSRVGIPRSRLKRDRAARFYFLCLLFCGFFLQISSLPSTAARHQHRKVSVINSLLLHVLRVCDSLSSLYRKYMCSYCCLKRNF